MSLQKSLILFSKMVGEDEKTRLAEELGVSLSMGDGVCLSHPYMIGRKKSGVFGCIHDHVVKKVTG